MPKFMLIHPFLLKFKNYAIWLAESVFDYAQLKIIKSPFILFQSIHAFKKSC